jgi:hypothetical protein
MTSPIATLFSDNLQFDYQAIDPHRIDQQYLMDCQMVVVDGDADLNETMWRTIVDFASDGGSVVVLPSDETKAENDTLSVNMIASQNEFFSDIFVNIPDNADLPKVYKHTQIRKLKFRNTLTLMSLQNGTSFFTLSKVGGGNIFSFASQLGGDWTNFADNALFVPVMYKIAMLGAQTGRLSYTIGIDRELTVNDLTAFAESDVRIRNEQGNFEMIPVVDLRNNRAVVRLYDELPGAGFYTVNKGDELIATTAWNDSRAESKMQFMNGEEVSKLMKDNGLNVLTVMKAGEIRSDDVMQMMVRRSMLWRTFILISLITLLIEILILRFWK